MKTEINLRRGYMLPREKKFYRLLKFIAVAIFLLSAAVAVFGLSYYRGLLEIRVQELKERNENLGESLGPVLQAENEIIALTEHMETENRLKERSIHWTGYFTYVKNAADGKAEIIQVSGMAEGMIVIDGKSPSLENIAAYTALLQKSDYLYDVYFDHAEYRTDKNNNRQENPSPYDSGKTYFLFTVYGTLKPE